jgi:hypothetical protein
VRTSVALPFDLGNALAENAPSEKEKAPHDLPFTGKAIFHAAYVERNRRMSENESETLTLFLQIFEGIEVIAEQIELLESAFGQEDEDTASSSESVIVRTEI